MGSFYGGQPGKSFEIKKIFQNKKSLVNDLSLETSDVLIGDFVCINYGSYGSADFDSNKGIDSDYGLSYDSTIWQKVVMSEKYEELTKAAGNGIIDYIQIFTGGGFVPSFTAEATTIASTGYANVSLEPEGQELKFIFSIPKGEPGEPLKVKDTIEKSISTETDYNITNAINEAISQAGTLNPAEDLIAVIITIEDTGIEKTYWAYIKEDGTSESIPMLGGGGVSLKKEYTTEGGDHYAYSVSYINSLSEEIITSTSETLTDYTPPQLN